MFRFFICLLQFLLVFSTCHASHRHHKKRKKAPNVQTVQAVQTVHYSYNLSVCMIFRDEANYLKEWIEFHRLLGVEHFYLYNNLSQDNYLEVLQPYIEQGIVELTEWNLPSANVVEWDHIQIGAYNDGLVKAKNTSKWLAILDSDEFLYPTIENNLLNYLERYTGFADFGGLLVNWVGFGTSWVEKIPDNRLMIETLTWREAHGNDHFKSVFLTDKVSYVCSPHYAIYDAGYRHYTPKGGLPPFIDVESIRINHYWPRDEWYLNNVKIPRRAAWGTDAATCKCWAEASNVEIGTEILRFVEPLRLRMNLKQ